MMKILLIKVISFLSLALFSSGFTQTLGDWTSLTSLPSPRWECSAVLVDTTIYILGGSEFSSGTSYPVLRAGILSDGTLSGWVEESCRPFEIHSEAVSFTHGGFLYLMSGSKGVSDSISTTMERAPINSDGSIGEWKIIGYTPKPFYCSSWVQTSTNLYVIGNYPGSGEVWRLPLYGNGSIGTWSLLSSNLNSGRYGAGATIVDGRIFIQGGCSDYANSDYAEVAQVLPDGNLDSWQLLTKPLALHWTHLLAKIGKRLYSISGCYPSWADTETESAEIQSDYTLGTWVGLSPYPNPRIHFAHLQTDKGLYVFGGFFNSPMPSVQFAPIIPPSSVKSSQWKGYE